MTRLLQALAIFLLLSIFACVPAGEKIYDGVQFDASNVDLKRAITFQDQRQQDSLVQLFRNEDPSIRFAAANAVASIPDFSALDSLNRLMSDPFGEVSEIAAFALGQQKRPEIEPYLIKSFTSQDTGSIDNQINQNILEAIGKTGSANTLDLISTTSTYGYDLTHLLLGQARGIYQYGLRDIISSEGTRRMVDIILDTQYPLATRRVAANYISRFPKANIDERKYQIADIFSKETDKDVRMALAIGLGRLEDEQINEVLMTIFNEEDDYRVKVNILRGLGKKSYSRAIETVLTSLKDKNIHVADAATQYLVRNGNATDATVYERFVRTDVQPLIKAKTYQAVLTHLPSYYVKAKERLHKTISGLMGETESPYVQAEFVKALGSDVANLPMLNEVGLKSDQLVVRTAAMSAFRNILRSEQFEKVYNSNSKRKNAKARIAEYIKTAMETGDVGVISEGAMIISNKDFGFNEVIEDASFLNIARDKLVLPRETEAYNAIVDAQNYLVTETSQSKAEKDVSHAIDWSVLETVSDSLRATIKTDKGDIVIKFFLKNAPGSVANFVSLARSDFYDGKNFHRVVPNFVIQGGCPRGDGYGSLDYTIRSEFSNLYYDKEGMVGMASAGPDTEGTQFFITHSPTMHLNGGYTIFAEVTSGMDVVHGIEQGDKIIDVEI